MVKKYYKYIIVILFGLFLFVPRETQALTNYASRFNDEEFNISGSTAYWYTVYSNFNNTWADAGGGYIRFNFSVTKISGTSTSQAIAPAAVSVANGLGNEFICDIGSTSVNNTTWNTQTYSAICPVHFYSGGGLHHIAFNWMRSNGDNSSYHVWFDGRVTLEIPQFINIPDTSANDNYNTNRIIAEQQRILQEQQKTTDAIDDLNDNITSPDIDVDDTEDNIDDFMNDNDVSSPTDVGIQDLITLPIKLLTGLLSSVNSSCNNITLVLLGNNIVFPCINLADYLGAAWNILDIIISCVLVYKFAKKLKEIFIDFTSLDTNKGDLIE